MGETAVASSAACGVSLLQAATSSTTPSDKYRACDGRRIAHPGGVRVVLVIDVVGDHHCSRPEVGYEHLKDLGVEGWATVEQQDLDRAAWVFEGLSGIAGSNVGEVIEACRYEILSGSRGFLFYELGANEGSSAVVTQTGGEVDGRDAKGRSELNNSFRLNSSDGLVEESSLLTVDRQVEVLKLVVPSLGCQIVSVFGFSSGPDRAAKLRHLGVGLCVEAFEEFRHGGVGK